LRQDLDWTGISFSQSQCDAWFEEDLGKAAAIAGRFPHFDALDDVRKAVLTSMTFQMGAGPLGWPRFTQALRDEDYERASEEGLDTLWHKQTPKRCELEMAMLKDGLWGTSAL
jgi:GH24 family phage-related lysozyme (muramidase)